MSTQTTSYRDVKAISNSILTEFEKSVKNFRNFWIYDNPFDVLDTSSLLIGSIIDTLFTREEEFFNMYYVSTLGDKTPQPQLLKFCRNLHAIWPEGKVEKNKVEELLKRAYETTGFGRDKFETVKDKFVNEGGKEFFNDLMRSQGKSVISNETYQRALKLVESCKLNEFVKDILSLKSSNLNGIELITVINQLEIYSVYTSEEGGCDIDVKGALDKVIIDHISKTVHPYDIKTSINLNSFEESYVKYRYFRQAGFYTWLLGKWLKEKGWEDYTIMPFKFLVISTAGDGAYIYQVEREDLVKSTEGGMTIYGVEYRGWRSLLDDICWHVKNNKWDYPKKVYEGNGLVPLRIFK